MTAIRIMEKKVTIRELLLSTFQQEILTHCYLLRRTVPSLMFHTFEEGISSTEMKCGFILCGCHRYKKNGQFYK